jgi:hypothetical protein
MIIREEQIKALADAFRQETVNRIVEHLDENHHEAIKDVSRPDLFERVEDGIKRAEAFGFQTESCMAWYVAMLFEISPRFDEQETINKFLADSELPEELKIEELLDAATEADWEAAAAL